MDGLARFQADTALRLAQARMHDLQLESANARLARREPRRPVGSFLAALRHAFGARASSGSPAFPTLADYPFRS